MRTVCISDVISNLEITQINEPESKGIQGGAHPNPSGIDMFVAISTITKYISHVASDLKQGILSGFTQKDG